MLDEKGQGAAHKHGWNEQKGKGDEARGQGGSSGGDGADAMKDPKRGCAESTNRELDKAEGEKQADAGATREPSAGEAAHPQAEHEDGHDHGYGFNVDSVEGEEGALPDDLIEERWEAGQKEKQVVDLICIPLHAHGFRIGHLGELYHAAGVNE